MANQIGYRHLGRYRDRRFPLESAACNGRFTYQSTFAAPSPSETSSQRHVAEDAEASPAPRSEWRSVALRKPLERAGARYRISFWNKGAEKLSSWTSDQVIGQELHLLPQTELPKLLEEIEAQLYREERFSAEVVQIARDGWRVLSLCRWGLDRDAECPGTDGYEVAWRIRQLPRSRAPSLSR